MEWLVGGVVVAHWYTYMWWLAGEDIPDIPAHLWSFDGSLVEMWWLTDGDLVSIWLMEMCWLIGELVVAHLIQKYFLQKVLCTLNREPCWRNGEGGGGGEVSVVLPGNSNFAK